jgi:hypothetical protein
MRRGGFGRPSFWPGFFEKAWPELVRAGRVLLLEPSEEPIMADERRAPHSLKEQTADQIRNEQRGGRNTPIDPNAEAGPAGNATVRKVWSEPGGEAHNYRNAMVGAGTKADDQGELTAAETPDATKRVGDATLSPNDQDATAEAIARATQGGNAASGTGT